MLELFKQLEIENDLQKNIDKLEELAEDQKKLSEETKNSDKSPEELKSDQEKLSEAFEKLEKELEELKEKNKELENPRNIEDTKDLEEKIKKDQQDSEDALGSEKKEDENKKDDQEGSGSDEAGEKDGQQDSEESQSQSSSEQQKSKASKSQKNAGQKMQQMADQLQAGMQAGQMDQMAEDMEMLRQLLENILTLSFNEEALVDDLGRTNEHTTKYVELVRDQYKIQDDFSIVRDSLQALSKRNDQIQSFVMDKVGDITQNLERSLTLLEDRKKAQAVAPQRYVMTYLNDLALMLSESMKNMQQQMAGMMAGAQMCNNPKPGQSGQGKPMDKITQGQGKIKEGLGQMKDKMDQGDQPSSEEFGKMAQQQAAMRKMLRDMQKQNSEQGQNSQLLQEIIDAMNSVEKDLVNKQLTNETLKRQQEIETRLLEAEKAERQRDFEDKRESKTGEAVEKKLPAAIEAYLKERSSTIRQVERSSPSLTPYYKRLVDLYYKTLQE